MKLTRKRAIEKAFNEGLIDYEPTHDAGKTAQVGVDYGIVLGLQMALEEMPPYDENTYPYVSRTLRRIIARRLKKLEKAQ